MNSLFVNIALGLLLPEIAAAAGTVDAATFKARINPKIEAAFAGSAIEPTVEGLVDACIDVAVTAIKDAADIKDLVTQAVAKNWPAAMLDLKNLMAKSIAALPPADLTPAVQTLAAIVTA